MKILMADDDPDDRNLMRMVWKKACVKHELFFARNGEELMHLLKKCSNNDGQSELPAVILLDLNMPKMDGRQALKEIKSIAGYNKINVMVFTTSDSEADKKYALENGASRYIVKPFQLDEWKEILQNICTEMTDQ